MIKFGVDGWIAGIAEEFTFANAANLGKALSAYLFNHQLTDKPFVVGYDPRFQADGVAVELAKLLESAGLNVLLTERDTPTPIIAWETADKAAAGGLVVTAGSRGSRYGGVKVLQPDGKLFNADQVKEISAYLYLEQSSANAAAVPNQLLLNYQSAVSQIGRVKKGTVERFEPRERYLAYLSAQVNKPRTAPLVVVDPLFGSARGYFDLFLQRFGCRVEVINGRRDVLFGGLEPDPAEANLAALKASVAALRADAGVAFNADASAYALIDRHGGYRAGEQTADPLLAALRAVCAIISP